MKQPTHNASAVAAAGYASSTVRASSGRVWMMASLLSVSCGQSTIGPTPDVTASSDPSAATVNVRGNYTLMVMASPMCSTPPDLARTASFPVVVIQANSNVSLAVSVTVAGFRERISLSGTVRGNELRFGTPTCVSCWCEELFLSDVSDEESFAMCGAASATVDNTRHIAGNFRGTFEYFARDSEGRLLSSSICPAADHSFILSLDQS
jgi:hypothetical protein